jgi:exonuclease SbcC
VLASFLDDVTREATHRLDRMSKGRYQLRRAQDASNRRSTAGLDLEVFDDFTGDSRSVNTLSGGEMFLASLSLALGLSDTVQGYSGGVHFDSIFIDEGFGSLDSSSLDLSIETLMELNEKGRMVGVISHVIELKERIDQQIQVKRTSNGSRVAR